MDILSYMGKICPDKLTVPSFADIEYTGTSVSSVIIKSPVEPYGEAGDDIFGCLPTLNELFIFNVLINNVPLIFVLSSINTGAASLAAADTYLSN